MPLRAWARVVTEFLRADAGQSAMLGQEHAQKLTEPQVVMNGQGDSYGLGWCVVAGGWGWGGARVVNHSGSNTLNHSIAWLSMTKGWGFLIVINASDVQGQITSNAMDELAGKMLAATPSMT
jgi:hypothetical protein